MATGKKYRVNGGGEKLKTLSHLFPEPGIHTENNKFFHSEITW